MTRRFVAALLIIGLALPLSGGAASADAAAWYNSAWKYRQKITVNHELVGGSVDGFPMLVKLTGTVFNKAQADGNDILFTAANGTTKLLHEIESMNGEVAAWVQMPHLSEKEDTVLYVYYGNPTAENQQSARNVWANGYAGVWHLNEDPAGTARNSASVGNNGASFGGMNKTDSLGRIGDAFKFDGTDDYVDVGTIGPSSTNVSVSAWIYTGTDAFDGTVQLIFDAPQASLGSPPVNGFWLAVEDRGGTEGGVTRRNAIQFEVATANTYTDDIAIDAITTNGNAWYHVAGTYDGSNSTMKVYVNGEDTNAGGGDGSGGGEFRPSTSGPALLGRYSSGSSLFFKGRIDEMRVSKVALSSAWIKTEYNNQSGRENFLTIAEPETQSTSTTAASGKSTSSLSSPLIQAINRLFNVAFDRFPTFTEWKFWADRVLAGDKDTFPELLGAMQWHKLFGGGTSGAVQGATTSGPTVEIRNGTTRAGLAGRTLERLSAAGYSVTTVGNAQDYSREQSKVYVVNRDAYDRAAELAETLKVDIGFDLPAGERGTTADILVVLGADFRE